MGRLELCLVAKPTKVPVAMGLVLAFMEGTCYTRNLAKRTRI